MQEFEQTLLSRYLSVPIRAIVQTALLVFGAAGMLFSMAGDLTQGNAILKLWFYDNVEAVGAVLHLILIILILFPGRMRHLNAEMEDERVSALVQGLNRFFLRSWRWLWICVGLLYSVMLYEYTHTFERVPVLWGWVDTDLHTILAQLQDLFDVASTIFLALCYYFLSPNFLRRYVTSISNAKFRSIPSKGGDSDNARDLREGRRIDREHFLAELRRGNRWYRYPAVLYIAGTGLLIGSIFMSFRLNTGGFLHITDHIDFLMNLSLGTFSAVVLGHLTGLLDGRFVAKWQWLILVLFGYATTQSLSPIMYTDEVIYRAMFIYTAFTMKCLLIIFISDFFESHRVVHYAHEVVRSGDRLI